MLAEVIVVPDGDSFLQEPIDVNEAGVPHLPPLTWSQMSHLHRELELILITGRTGRTSAFRSRGGPCQSWTSTSAPGRRSMAASDRGEGASP